MSRIQTIIKKDPKKFSAFPNLQNYDKADNSIYKSIEKEIKYFPKGKLNIAYNAIDVHVARGNGRKTALYFKSVSGKKETYSFSDLEILTNKFANVLVDFGIKKGDRVFIYLPTIPTRFITFLGTLKTGAIAGTLFSAFGEVALLDRLLDSDAKIVVTDSDLLPRVLSVWKKLPDLEKIIVINKNKRALPKVKNIYSYEDVMQKAIGSFSSEPMDPEDPSYMLYTSGSTGKPKGVVHSHRDIAQILLTTKLVLDLRENDIYWGTADAGWVTGVVYGILGAWLVGATQVCFDGRFSAQDWYKILSEYKVSVWYTAPTAIRMLMGSSIDRNLVNLSSLRFIASVGEPLNPEAIWWGLDNFELPIHDNWWQTELGSICIANFASLDIRPGSMGKPIPGLKVAIVDEKGKETQFDEEGDLAIKIDTLSSFMKKIWKNKKKFDSYFSNGWYLSGDRAKKDKDGYFWFVGRSDDLIKTAGQRIGPFEIESILIEHPAILEAGVIGKQDPLRGEIIKAFIVLKSGFKESKKLKEEIIDFVKKRLSANAYPREIEFIKKLPKTRSGKIMRRILRAKETGKPLGDISALE